MLAVTGHASLDELTAAALPPGLADPDPLDLPPAASEAEALAELRRLAGRNTVAQSMIGLGYYGTVTPAVIRRNVLENPAWYTAYTPYQPEISQGRLEALLTFQTMVEDLTALPVAGASLLDEATAAAEAMTLARRSAGQGRIFLADADCLPQTLAVLATRAEPLGIELVTGPVTAELIAAQPAGELFGVLLPYPGASGQVRDLAPVIAAAHEHGALAAVAADLLALTLLVPPGEQGADIAVGSTQRFGVPMGYGGPHAAYIAVRDGLRRQLPGRLVGRVPGRRRQARLPARAAGPRAAHPPREGDQQHLHRPGAAGRDGRHVRGLPRPGRAGRHRPGRAPEGGPAGRHAARARGGRRVGRVLRHRPGQPARRGRGGGRAGPPGRVQPAAGQPGHGADRGATKPPPTQQVAEVAAAVAGLAGPPPLAEPAPVLPEALRRSSGYLDHPVFHEHRSETAMLRYLRRLADFDIALDRSMIPLGSCTMKLNAAAEMEAVSWPEFAGLHPFAPAGQAAGYTELIGDLERWLAELTGYDAVSVQPNAGSQGELAGLLAIRAYHSARGDAGRDICLIPESAHGTNAASAVLAGLRVVVVKCADDGAIDEADLAAKLAARGPQVAAIMLTYPSTNGVFEEGVQAVCAAVHDAGGQVYVDGANLNALVGLARPGRFGADVSHLNLHKTFCIPHGGGGPGVGPVAVRSHLAPYLPGRESGPVAAAPYGSAGILPISWAYIRMMGAPGLRQATQVAILAANYVAARLAPHYPVLYTGRGGLVAHECIVDIRPLTRQAGVTVEDVAKRLIDYGFHAPTMSFPVAGTLMIEPTESEDLATLDRFCDAMIAIRREIDRIGSGEYDSQDNPLRNAPHTASMLLAADWKHPYERAEAAYPLAGDRRAKYWPPVRRIDQAYGDRNLICACPPASAFEE